MGAPKNNQFWKQRTKHGRDKIFKTPNDLWLAACEYFEWCDSNPLIEIDYKGKDNEMVNYPRIRAYTIRDLCRFLGVNEMYINQFEATCSKDFSIIITRIRDIIYTQKFQGAAAGMLNPNIIARDLGLTDSKKTDITTNGKEITPVEIIFEPKAPNEKDDNS